MNIFLQIRVDGDVSGKFSKSGIVAAPFKGGRKRKEIDEYCQFMLAQGISVRRVSSNMPPYSVASRETVSKVAKKINMVAHKRKVAQKLTAKQKED